MHGCMDDGYMEPRLHGRMGSWRDGRAEPCPYGRNNPHAVYLTWKNPRPTWPHDEQVLTASRCGLSDLSGIGGLRALCSLQIDRNKITDLAPLQGAWGQWRLCVCAAGLRGVHVW
jgi:hypothetical protein